MTVGGMGFIPERLLMMMMMIYGVYIAYASTSNHIRICKNINTYRSPCGHVARSWDDLGDLMLLSPWWITISLINKISTYTGNWKRLITPGILGSVA